MLSMSSGGTASPATGGWFFLVDENLPRLLASQLRTAGYQAEDVREVGLGAHPDADVWRYARGQARIIITQDSDFADIRAYPPPHAGIVIADLPDRLVIAAKMQVILDGLASLVGQSLANAIVTIAPGKVRVRR
jgi:predicted nuclease of predicted toxin-antitoxin system